MSDDWRHELASEQQKEKLRFFGCTWDDGITAGQAEDSLAECAKQFPDAAATWQKNQPATEKQKGKLHYFGCTWSGEINVGQANDALLQCANDFPDKEADWQFQEKECSKIAIVPGASPKSISRPEEILSQEQPIQNPAPVASQPPFLEARHEGIFGGESQPGTPAGSVLRHSPPAGQITRKSAVAKPVFIPPTPEQLSDIRSFGQTPLSGLTFQEATTWNEQCKFLNPAKPQTSTQILTYEAARQMGEQEWHEWIGLHGSYGTEPGHKLTYGEARALSLPAWIEWAVQHGRITSIKRNERQKKEEFLREQLKESQKPSDKITSEEVTIQEAGKPKNVHPYEFTIPARDAQNLPKRPPPTTGKKQVRSKLSQLTEDTIRKKTQTGDTPLHRAAKQGRIDEIPKHLLSIGLFLITNFRDQTPVHVAARYGTLDKVPPEFLSKETMTASTEYGESLVYTRKESKTGTTPPKTQSPLHTAVRYGNADQIPKQFLAPEFLSIQASGYRLTVLHELAYASRLDLVPDIYASSEMWNLRNSSGQTPRDIVQANIEHKAYVARVRSEPATEKQKEKLGWFGYAVHEGMTKGEASDALDKCVKDYPEKDRAYYNRPATSEQMAKIREYFSESPEDAGGPFTYKEAKDMIWEREMEKRTEERQNLIPAFYSNDPEIEAEIYGALGLVDFTYGMTTRDITGEEIVKAFYLAKSKGKGKPNRNDVIAALEELYPDFRPLPPNYRNTRI